MAQKQYRASGTKGVFKQYDIGAQAQVRAMRDQVTPILNAHKRNAEAIFAEQNRHLSAIQRAQSDEEQNRKSNQGFEIDKLNNIQRQYQKRADTLGRYASEGYNEIMSQAIQMSPFSQWSQTFLKVAEIAVQAGYKVATQNATANQERGTVEEFIYGDMPTDEKTEAANQSNSEVTQNIINEVETDERKALGGGEKRETSFNAGDPAAQADAAQIPLARELNTARVTTMAQESQLLEETVKLYDELVAKAQPGESKVELWRKAAQMKAAEHRLRDNSLPDARKLEKSLYDFVKGRQNDQILRIARSAFEADYRDIQKTLAHPPDGIDTVEAVFHRMNSPGSTVRHPQTGRLMNTPGDQVVVAKLIYSNLIESGQHELAEEFMFKWRPTKLDAKGKKIQDPTYKNLYDKHTALAQWVENGGSRSRNQVSAANQNSAKFRWESKQKISQIDESLRLKEGDEGYENSINFHDNNGTLAEWGRKEIATLNASGHTDAANHLSLIVASKTNLIEFLPDESLLTHWRRVGDYNSLAKFGGMYKIGSEKMRDFDQENFNFDKQLRGTDYNITETTVMLRTKLAEQLNVTALVKAGINVPTLREKTLEAKALFAEKLESYLNGVDPNTGKEIKIDAQQALNRVRGEVDREITAGRDDRNSTWWVKPASERKAGELKNTFGNAWETWSNESLPVNQIADQMIFRYHPITNKITGQSSFINPLDILRDPTKIGIPGVTEIFPQRVHDSQFADLQAGRTVTPTDNQVEIYRRILPHLDGEKPTIGEFLEASLTGGGYTVTEDMRALLSRNELISDATIPGTELNRIIDTFKIGVARGDETYAKAVAAYTALASDDKPIINPVVFEKRQLIREQLLKARELEAEQFNKATEGGGHVRNKKEYYNFPLSDTQKEIEAVLPEGTVIVTPTEHFYRNNSLGVSIENWDAVLECAKSEHANMCITTLIDDPVPATINVELN